VVRVGRARVEAHKHRRDLGSAQDHSIYS